MKYATQIENWIAIGLQQPVGSLMEYFYFDEEEYTFFSIVVTDYFMLDEDLSKSNSTTTTYTNEQEDYLVKKINQVENNHPAIISIPRIPVAERKKLMKEFADALTDESLKEILYQRIANQDYSTMFDFYFGNEASDLEKEQWEDLKANFLQQKIDAFINANNIDISRATLWEAEAKGSVTIDLTKNKKQETSTAILSVSNFKKPWWQFWK